MTEPIKVDDWMIVDDGFSGPLYRAMRIVKVTDQKVVASDAGRSQARHFYKDRLKFVGTEDECRRYVERLTSSVGLMTDECRRSRVRHNERVAKILAEAKGSDQ